MSIGFLDLGNERLEYLRIAPDRHGTPLVFLHEGLGSVAGWRDFPRKVCDALNAPGLLYSRCGYGQSTQLAAPRAPDYLHREAWVVLPALLDALGIAQPFLVGHSDGGSIALLYAARFDPRAIAIMAPHVFVEEVTLEGIRTARAAWNEGKLRDKLSRLHTDPDGAFFGWNDGWLSPEFRDWNIERELEFIRCTVLAIQGYDDEYATMEQLDRIAAGLARGAAPPCELLKLDACGHAPQRDQPQAVLAAIATLYARCAPRNEHD
ncbi:MAG: alpha/beta hydrolase [Burkholderiales bacterium]|jgi:pimeloyl-ACP methyl ester carboxylesterase|nr:alpha/beta hydrolase [Burkholderiales bacterium]